MILNHLVGGLMNNILIALVLMVMMSGNSYAYKVTEEGLLDTANQMNKTLPRTFPNGVLLESVSYIGNFTLLYNYRFSNILKNSIGDTSLLKKQMRNALCTNPATKQFFDQGVTLETHWYDKNWSFVYKVITNKYDC